MPTGPKAGAPVKLAPFQKQFIKGALADDVDIAVLSVGRGNGKSTLSAGLALGTLLGIWDDQPAREILIAARNRDQARIAWEYGKLFSRSLPEDVQKRLTFRHSPKLEIQYDDDNGEHFLRAIAADGKSALGTSPNLVLMDERGHWPVQQGDDLEHALLTGLGKRGGRALIISTSANNDAHPFSRWIDDPEPRTYVQEHRPSPALPADDKDSLLLANPGAKHGIGIPLAKLRQDAERAISRGGSTLASFRLYNRNERVAAENRDILITLDEWLTCEVAELPPRVGSVIIGIDLGGSASMTAAAFYWPETNRLECVGTFPSNPGLLERGQIDGVSGLYVQMKDRKELSTLGDKTVPVAPWMGRVLGHVEGETIGAIVADRFKQAELGEAMGKAGVSAPVIWRGMGFRDGGEDCERFRRACFDERVKSRPSVLLRAAFGDTVTLRDPANNVKLAKARSLGRIDAAAATVLAVAEGARRTARPIKETRAPVWV
ncbi:MAG: terminase [Rhodobacteraceae bacterium]|nr:terminase [Paracoccaceae bacterium]